MKLKSFILIFLFINILNASEEPKVVRRFGKTIPWLAEAVKSAEVASDLDVSKV